jgi:hypothetical protein
MDAHVLDGIVQEVDEMSRRGPQPIDPFAEPEVAPTAEVEEAEKCDPLQVRQKGPKHHQSQSEQRRKKWLGC